MSAVKDTNGEVVCDDDKILDRWREYCESPYSVADPIQEKCLLPTELEPCLLRDEVKAALARAQSGKAPAPDDVSVELLKLGFASFVYSERLGSWRLAR